MGEMADDLIDRMIDDGFYPSPHFMPRGSKKKKHKKPEEVFIPAVNYNQKRKEPDPKKFDMSFFPTANPKPVEPEPVKSVWDTEGEDSPF